MNGETDLRKILATLSPKLNEGTYIFSTVLDLENINRSDTICEFKEEEGITIVMNKKKADELGLAYDFEASWITLLVHTSLEGVGLTAKFSTELANSNISCNVIAGFYHDHIFVDKKDTDQAMMILESISENNK